MIVKILAGALGADWLAIGIVGAFDIFGLVQPEPIVTAQGKIFTLMLVLATGLLLSLIPTGETHDR